MYFRPELYPEDIPPVVNRFIGITGIAEWKRRTKRLAQQLRENTFLDEYFDQVYALEIEFTRFMHEWTSTRCMPVGPATEDRYRLLAFMATTAMVHERLTPVGQNRLRGMILHGLSDHGLTPLQQEMSTAAHLLLRGFDVSFSDIESGTGGFDFLARMDDIELEVECERVGISLAEKFRGSKRCNCTSASTKR